MSTITVAAGDTLTSLAKKHGVTVAALKAANGLGTSAIIKVGQKLTLPGATAAPPAAPGAFLEIPVDDRSATFGALASGPLKQSDVRSIILHRTGGSAASALRAYADRIANNSMIGAHYLIDEKGKVILTVPIDRRVSHVGRTRDGFENSNNSHAIGIEHAGSPLALDVPASAKDAATIQKNRNSIAHMDISPLFRQRLLGLADRDLFQVARDNRDGAKWFLYGDLDESQRRASYVLAAALLAHFGLAEKDLLAHETVSFKSIGEGENIKEFLSARFAYPGLFAQLDAQVKADAALRANAALAELVAVEKALADALEVDASAAENAALAAGNGPGNPVAAREDLRTAFYGKFWQRSAQLADLVDFLAAGAGQAEELAQKVAAWVK